MNNKLRTQEFWKEHAEYWSTAARYWERYKDSERAKICREWEAVARKYVKGGERHD